jgi:hypothetical protein
MMVWFGQQVLLERTRLAYMTEELRKGEMLFLRNAKPNFEKNGYIVKVLTMTANIDKYINSNNDGRFHK